MKDHGGSELTVGDEWFPLTSIASDATCGSLIVGSAFVSGSLTVVVFA